MTYKTECYCDGDYICTHCEVQEAEEPTEGERETNRLLHYITGGDFL